MIIKIKKRSLFLFALVFFLGAFAFLLLHVKIVAAACSGTDTYTFSVFDPAKNLIRTATEAINPVTGTACNSPTTNTAEIYVSCQTNGTYWANITCAGCSDAQHVDQTDTPILNCTGPEEQQFVIKNTTGHTIVSFDEKGYVYLKGLNHSNQGPLDPPPRSFIIKNKSGQPVAFIPLNGSLWLTGDITMRQSPLNTPPSSFIIRNSTGKDVAYIDDKGNLVLTSVIYHNWTPFASP